MAENFITSVQGIDSWLDRHSLLRHAAIDAVRLILIVVVAEILLRWLTPEYSKMRYDRQFTGGYPIMMNVDGYRGPSVSKKKSSHINRVIALGDSTTFGTGVAWDSSWPAQLQNIANEKGGQPLEVINAALPAASLGELIFSFQKKWSTYEPDIVVLAISGNMLANAWTRRGDDAKMPRNPYMNSSHSRNRRTRFYEQLIDLRHRLCLPSALMVNGTIVLYQIGLRTHHLDATNPQGPLLSYGYIQGDLSNGLSEIAWSILGDELIELKNCTAKANARLLITFLPCRFIVTDHWQDNLKALPRERLTIDPIDKSRKLCRLENIPYINALEALKTERVAITEALDRFDPLYLLGDYNHLNPNGHRAVAQAISKKLLSGEK
jgi:lysophospholipase L1-like esterase